MGLYDSEPDRPSTNTVKPPDSRCAGLRWPPDRPSTNTVKPPAQLNEVIRNPRTASADGNLDQIIKVVCGAIAVLLVIFGVVFLNMNSSRSPENLEITKRELAAKRDALLSLDESSVRRSENISIEPKQEVPIETAPVSAETLDHQHGKYVGEVANGKANGRGTYTSYKSETTYTGEFVNDKFTGNGTMTWKDGARFVGNWLQDVGVQGNIKYPNGTVVSGTVKSGKFSPASAN